MDLKLRKWAELYGEDLCIRAYSLYKNEDKNPKIILQQLLSSEQLSKIKSNKINAHANGIIEAGKCLVGEIAESHEEIQDFSVEDVEQLALKAYPINPFYDGDQLMDADTNHDLRKGWIKGYLFLADEILEKTNGWVNSPARPAHMHGALEALINPSIYNKAGLISFEDAYNFFKWTQSRKCTYYHTVGGYWLSCMEDESKKTTQELYQIYKEENGS